LTFLSAINKMIAQLIIFDNVYFSLTAAQGNLSNS